MRQQGRGKGDSGEAGRTEQKQEGTKKMAKRRKGEKTKRGSEEGQEGHTRANNEGEKGNDAPRPDSAHETVSEAKTLQVRHDREEGG